MQQPVQWIMRTEAIQANQADSFVYNRLTVLAKTKEEAVARFWRRPGEKLAIEGFVDSGSSHYYPTPIPVA